MQSEARRHYVLVGHSPAFDCGPDYNGRTFVEEEAATFHLLTNGSLRGSFPGQNVSRVQVWERAQYCLLIGAVPDFSYTYSDYGANTSAATYSDYSDYSEGGTFPIRQTFMNCLEHEKLTWEQQFNAVFHPTALSISIVFLVLILVVYILDSHLRESFMGKMTVGFISNLICCFVCITDSFVKDSDPRHDRRESLGCVLTGYLIIYFFHAYFLWVNAMAVHLWLSLTSLVSWRAPDSRKLVVTVVYAQGLPALLCGLTALVDWSGSRQQKEQFPYYPDIGVYNCYLPTRFAASYFLTPVFIYQQSLLLATMAVNVVLTAQVCWTTLASRKAAAASGAVSKDSSRHLAMFAKIFTVLGFTWISEIVSTALHVEHHQQTFHVRLFLDLVNLFLVSRGNSDDLIHWRLCMDMEFKLTAENCGLYFLALN